MRKLTEEEAWESAGDIEPPLLAKAENEFTQCAVSLKRWPHWFILAMHRESDDRLDMFAFNDESEAWQRYEGQVAKLNTTGDPFFD